MKNERGIQSRRQEFSLNAVMLSVLGFLIVILLTVAGVFDPQFKHLDNWSSTLEGQKAITWIVFIIIGLFAFWWLLFKVVKIQQWKDLI